MLAEYDFSSGTKGKYAKLYNQGTNLILLEPDVAEAFPDSKSINDSLRALASIIQVRFIGDSRSKLSANTPSPTGWILQCAR